MALPLESESMIFVISWLGWILVIEAAHSLSFHFFMFKVIDFALEIINLTHRNPPNISNWLKILILRLNLSSHFSTCRRIRPHNILHNLHLFFHLINLVELVDLRVFFYILGACKYGVTFTSLPLLLLGDRLLSWREIRCISSLR